MKKNPSINPDNFLFLLNSEKILEPIRNVALHPALESSKLAFEANISGAMEVGHMPFVLVRSAVWQSEFDRISISKRILKLKDAHPDKELSAKQTNSADEEALRELTNIWKSPEGKERFSLQAVDRLLQALNMPEYFNAASELLRQLTVLTWNSFEILFSESLRAAINSSPGISTRLFQAKEFKGLISLEKLLAVLQASKFDISNQLGHFISGEVNFDSLGKIRSASQALYQDECLDLALKSDQLYLLNLKRNLIVHRRGVIDERFIRRCSSNQKIGERISSTSADLENDLIFTVDLGVKLLRAASRTLDEDLGED